MLSRRSRIYITLNVIINVECYEGEQEYISHHKCYEGELKNIYHIINVIKENTEYIYHIINVIKEN